MAGPRRLCDPARGGVDYQIHDAGGNETGAAKGAARGVDRAVGPGDQGRLTKRTLPEKDVTGMAVESSATTLN